MKRLTIILLLPLMVVAGSGCAMFNVPATPEAQLFVACRSFADTEKAIRVFKAKMTHTQQTIIKDAIKIAKPICTGETKNLSDPTAALEMVRDYLKKMVVVQNEVKP